VIKRKYVVLSLLTLVSILLAGLIYSNIVQAQTTVTGYVSVPAAAFVPWDNTFSFEISYYIKNKDAAARAFCGSVQLPNGATVTKLTYYWYDNGTYSVSLMLLRRNNTLTGQTMAFVTSSGDTGYGSSYDDTILNATVDNSRYAYYLVAIIPASASHNDYLFNYAVIEYTLPSEGAVGGMLIPVDKLSLLVPYIALVSTIILAVSISVAYIKYRKKQ